MTMHDSRIDTPYWTLRMTYGLVPIVAGLDKFANILVDWDKYLSPLATDILPIPGYQFMYAVGVIEIIAGLLVLSRFARFGAYLVSGWLAAIAINLVTTGQYYDIAVRDTVMAIGAFCLARLHEARAESRVPVRRRVDDIGRPIPVPT
jgi:uncharacterized membrane protein YphA (DoxX/SURF4 family)